MNLVDRLIQLDRESPKRVLVIGDCMFDIYVQGRLEPTCQEGCPKFVQESYITVPGGAANAARSLGHWNCAVVCLPGKTPSLPHKTRLMVGNKCEFRYDDDYCGLNLGLVRDEIMRVLEDWRSDAVLMSDYDKGLLTPDFIRAVVTRCRERGVPCVADAKREPELHCGAILKVNEDYSKRYPKWWERHDSNYVQSLGADGPVIRYGRYDDTWVYGCDLPLVPCVNHVGAGDCFSAHLTLALAHGLSLKEAAAVAHSAGRVYVQYPHNRPPRPEEISADMGF